MGIEFRPVAPDEFEDCARVIRHSFKTVADDLRLTRETAPTNPAFLTVDALEKMYSNGTEMFSILEDGKRVGFVALENAGEGLYYMEKLCCLPYYRHRGFGRKAMDFVFDRVRKSGGERVSIGIIDENKVLKAWYEDYGFREMELKQLSHLPFTVCIMEKAIRHPQF